MTALLPLFVVLGLPILEIATFVYVGQWLGVWRTVGLVVLAALIGVAVLRYQGIGAMKRINRDLRHAQPPAASIVDGFMIVVASILLIIPGFLTDIVGLLLMIPPVRRLVWKVWGKSINVSYTNGFRRRKRSDFVDLSPDVFAARTTRNLPNVTLTAPNEPRVVSLSLKC